MDLAELEDVVEAVSCKETHGMAGMFEAVKLLLKPNGKCLVICQTSERARHMLRATCMLLDGAMMVDNRPNTTYRLHQSDIRLENGSVLKSFSMESSSDRLRGTTFDLAVWL